MSQPSHPFLSPQIRAIGATQTAGHDANGETGARCRSTLDCGLRSVSITIVEAIENSIAGEPSRNFQMKQTPGAGSGWNPQA